MILKTSLLSLILLTSANQAFAFNRFDCLRDLLPVTAYGAFQHKRKNVEQPFMIGDRHMVFAEVNSKSRVVTGFYIYSRDGAAYYDAVLGESVAAQPLADLKKDKTLYQLVVQPNGLETVTIYFQPGYKAKESNGGGPVALGVSVLPVVGAFVSRPEKVDYVYQNPVANRAPAAFDGPKGKLAKLVTKKPKSDLWAPLAEEIELREAWSRNHNLDDATFRRLEQITQTSCKR